jgi:hypothetical protein
VRHPEQRQQRGGNQDGRNHHESDCERSHRPA